MILFLSFDGVLHPAGQLNQSFSKLPLLESWLRAHQEIKVVVSSKWRKNMPFEDICHIFSDDIKPRVIGTTPDLQEDSQDAHWRLSEIFDWLKCCGDQHPWIVLDDGEFPTAFNRLVRCDPDTGLTEHDIHALTQLKSEMTLQATAH
ncbi:hypothetical protein LG201_03265 [Methylobacillus gramineus]|uniref:HAD domain-containing protein n=1 Tax=Methylobacillus gramineus TaxID=755169 RepID=UPI001CFFC5DC|nr:HAD domain-containing protein [Methylobacillus gramineus]MCB5184218.1 hypothetical protein [Methylobacillus gramineus]